MKAPHTERVEYGVRATQRYVVTRYHEDSEGVGRGSVCGEFDSYETAYAAAWSLCEAERARLGWPTDDERIQYPQSEAGGPRARPEG